MSGEELLNAAVTSRASNVAFPAPAPPLDEPIVVGLWKPN
jgi:hypothetical protein